MTYSKALHPPHLLQAEGLLRVIWHHIDDLDCLYALSGAGRSTEQEVWYASTTCALFIATACHKCLDPRPSSSHPCTCVASAPCLLQHMDSCCSCNHHVAAPFLRVHMQLVELFEREGSWPHALACYDLGLYNCQPGWPVAQALTGQAGLISSPHGPSLSRDHQEGGPRGGQQAPHTSLVALQAGLGQCLRQLGCGPAAQLLLAGANLQLQHHDHHQGSTRMSGISGASDLLDQQYELAWRMGQWQLPDWATSNPGPSGPPVVSPTRCPAPALGATPHPAGKGASAAPTPAAAALRVADGTQAGGPVPGTSPPDGSQGSHTHSVSSSMSGTGVGLQSEGGATSTGFNHSVLHSLRALRQGDTQRFSSLTAQAVAGK
jgi:hypothetical protein